MQKKVGEIFFDHVALVAEANDELRDAVASVNFHDMQQDRLTTDRDHGLGSDGAFLGNPSPATAGKDHGFHDAGPHSGQVKSPRATNLACSLSPNVEREQAEPAAPL